MLIRNIIKCPSCKKFLGNFVCCDHKDREGSSHDKLIGMASDGCDWAMEAFDEDNYAMCTECQHVFDRETGDNGGSTVYREPRHPKRKSFFQVVADKMFNSFGAKEEEDDYNKRDVIVCGLNLYKRALELVEKGEKARYSLLLKYIWEIERLDKDEKLSYERQYDEALSEVLEILEADEDEENSRSTRMDDFMLIGGAQGERLIAEENSTKREYYRLVYVVETLLKVEFYRRKTMYDRAIEILDENSRIFFEDYKVLADALMYHCENKNPKLFYTVVKNKHYGENIMY